MIDTTGRDPEALAEVTFDFKGPYSELDELLNSIENNEHCNLTHCRPTPLEGGNDG